MIEQGKIIKIYENIAEIEIPSNLNCYKCQACLVVSPDKRVVPAENGVSAKIGDMVKVFIDENKIKAGFLLYILPVMSFFMFLILADKIFYIKSEPLSALLGFAGMVLTFFIVRIFASTKKIKNYIIEIVNHKTTEKRKK